MLTWRAVYKIAVAVPNEMFHEKKLMCERDLNVMVVTQ